MYDARTLCVVYDELLVAYATGDVGTTVAAKKATHGEGCDFDTFVNISHYTFSVYSFVSNN